MTENNKEIQKHLKEIKYLLAGILLNKKPNIKEVAKAAGCSDKTLTKLFPERKKNAKTEN
jgi:AraC-like DNA-binding protein